MYKSAIGWLLTIILSLVLIITSFIGGGVVLAGIFEISIWIGSIIFGCSYIFLMLLAFRFLIKDS